MKKYPVVLLIAVVAAQLMLGCTRGYESQKNANECYLLSAIRL